MACPNNMIHSRGKNEMMRFTILVLFVVGTTLLSESHVHYMELVGSGTNAEIDNDAFCVILDSLGCVCIILSVILFVMARRGRCR